MAFFETPMVGEETTTLAPGTTAPELSVIVPPIEVSNVCAASGAQVKIPLSEKSSKIIARKLRMMVS